MTQQFKKGDKVRATAAVEELTWSAGDDNRVHEGDVGTYVERNTYHVVDFPQRKRVHLKDTEIEPYVEPKPEWEALAIGDKVKVRLKHTGEEFETVAYRQDPASNYVRVLGYVTSAGLLRQRFELLDVTAPVPPKPLPPTTPGSVISVEWPAWESGRNHLFLRESGLWQTEGKGTGFWKPEDIQARGFELHYDAGAEV